MRVGLAEFNSIYATSKLMTITVLVESDDANPYREGSADAAPIALKIMEQIQAGSGKASVENQNSVGTTVYVRNVRYVVEWLMLKSDRRCYF